MSQILAAVFNFSIYIAAIIALVKFRKISRSFHPFIFLVWIAAANETLSFVLMHSGLYTAVNNNIYVLIEGLLIMLFFKKMQIFERKPYIYNILIFLIIGVWVTENLIISYITYFSSYYRIFYSFVIVLVSLSCINSLLINEKSSLLKNSFFLICLGFILYFTYKVFVEIFWLYGIKSIEFSNRVFDILTYLNFISNLIYALAILWIPRRKEYIQQS